MRTTGRQLAREWKVDIAQALYHHEGRWYHRLEHFPAALFDPSGYVRFNSEAEYRACEGLQHGEHLHVPGGISRLCGYVRATAKMSWPS